MSVVSGKEFNRINLDKVFIKLTNESENHNGFKFETGLNQDTIPFNPKGRCKAGGIYFCEYEKMGRWLKYRGEQMIYYRYVRVPDDAKVYIEKDKYKTDKLILTERKEIKEIIDMMTEEMLLDIVKRDGYALEYIKNQTERICLEAVRNRGLALEYVIDQTKEICIIAVGRNGLALDYVKDRTPEICMAAVKQNGWALQYVKEENQTEEICIAAVQQDGLALKYVKNQTKDICLAAIKENTMALKYVDSYSKELYEIALETDYSAVMHKMGVGRFRLDALYFNRKQ
jgi:hypothetical protein